jgi:anti-sigma regulatory factor (Ser/Thr protein kinase)
VSDAEEELFSGEFDRNSIVSVRHEVARRSAQAGLTDPALYRFVVAVNEVVTNAVRHGGGAGRLRLWLHGRRVHCRVVDRGPGIPPARRAWADRPAPDTVGGWGLWLARQGCEALTVHSDRHGSTITLTSPMAVAG